MLVINIKSGKSVHDGLVYLVIEPYGVHGETVGVLHHEAKVILAGLALIFLAGEVTVILRAVNEPYGCNAGSRTERKVSVVGRLVYRNLNVTGIIGRLEAGTAVGAVKFIGCTGRESNGAKHRTTHIFKYLVHSCYINLIYT